MEWQKIVSPNDRTALVYAGILRKLNSGLKIAYIGEDGDEPDWPTALEDFDAHLRSVSVNKTELADALLQKGVFPAAAPEDWETAIIVSTAAVSTSRAWIFKTKLQLAAPKDWETAIISSTAAAGTSGASIFKSRATDLEELK